MRGDEEYMKETKDKSEIPEIVKVYMEKIRKLCRKTEPTFYLSAPRHQKIMTVRSIMRWKSMLQKIRSRMWI